MKLEQVQTNSRAAFYLKIRATSPKNKAIKAWEVAARALAIYRLLLGEYESANKVLESLWESLDKVEPKRYSDAGEALADARKAVRNATTRLSNASAHVHGSLTPAHVGGHYLDHDSREPMFYLSNDDGAGVFRSVECAHDHGIDHTGWFTNEYNESFNDGTGKCWGVVALLPAKNGRQRWLAGYQMGGQESGVALCLSDIFESPEDAARSADSHAENAAGNELEYQIAWEAGNEYARHLESIRTARRNALAVLAERRDVGAVFTNPKGYPLLCDAIRTRVSGYRATITEAREAMAELSGQYWNKVQRDAFCEAAEIEVMPS